MAKIKISELEQTIHQLLHAAGLNEDNASIATEVFMRATLRGVGHHDVYDLPGRLEGLSKGKIKANPEMVLIHKYAALENYEGDNGLGELGGMFIMKRAQQLADEHGIGLCAIRNSNHLLSSTPYLEQPAEEGYISYIITRGAPTMGAPGRKEKVIGTSPMGYAIPTNRDYPIMFDACLAYASNGVLSDKTRAGEEVPSHWGLDVDGKPTTSPGLISKGTRLPIGGHKGFGLTLFGEVITGILAEGQIIDEPQPGSGLVGIPSHTAICIKAGGLLGQREFTHKTTEILERMEARASGLQIPGQHSYQRKAKLLSEETIDLTANLLDKLNEWAQKFNLKTLE
ncbi:Ldh family oxidoreductase [Paenibacillus agricola]|uniref:Ldh family oxidoreductase n=1 Tax=Paenibacillus agricola TaxID=2716264 RepID=A0ABX0JFI2_9BACL|nr:Ldh family oxidoreductase [Paenibacillus agricola]NHN34150.1 Ldh family oxidoreductase [Paenibacillus agricola]